MTKWERYKGEVIMPKRVSFDAEAAYEIYLRYPEIGTAEIKRIFCCGDSTAAKMKKPALAEMKTQGKETLFAHNVNTKCAFAAWKIDIADLERRVRKLKSLGVNT